MLHIYNSFTHKKEPFVPLKPHHIGLYVCGITVYDNCHIGHARVFVAFDVIVRFLRASGWQVNYVRNITDVDDKIINRATENNESINELTERFIEAMHNDAKALNVLIPDEEPRATHHIDTIIAMINKLIDKKFAYLGDNGDVYFEVNRFSGYGELSHKNMDQLQSGARVEVVEAKRSPLDFVLWKKAKADEPHWGSPWGIGRPGWHIECSAMSVASLGDTFDIHGGGADLLFPHHENERAQSECATGHPFVNYWMHVGFVQIDKEKMSKSLNNFFTIKEVLKEYDAEVIRYFLIASHYRSPVNYSKEQLDQAKSALERFYIALRGIEFPPSSSPKLASLRTQSPLDPEVMSCTSLSTSIFYQRFMDAMLDDFNTPVALSVLFDCAHALNSAREKNDPQYMAIAQTLKTCANILGILNSSPESFLQGKKEDAASIELLITQREQARTDKNWAKADEIRQALTALGIAIEDTSQGTIWRKI